MIIGTAGHIDHGKTSLVKALTGVDVDTLKEEKARGITIDLGFAYAHGGDAGPIGFVDVPGHEKLVRNMLAGATGIDCVMLVVAADDGPMPQTVEHLAILDLLGLSRGVVALTKSDRVDDAHLARVQSQVRALLAPTGLSAAPILPVSSVTRDGIDTLERHLHALRDDAPALPDDGHFRLAVDRSFSLPGVGTVVTGTAVSGRVAAGDRLVVSPDGRAVRVRGLHAQNARADAGRAGQRLALNLSGVEKDEVARGAWVVAEPAHAPTRRIDARLRVLASEGRPLEHWTPVHLHLGALDVGARVALLEGGSIEPGASAWVQLELDRPTCALYGDRFIVRDQSAQRTIGGGHVVDAFAAPARRRKRERVAALAATDRDAPGDALAALLALGTTDGVDVARFHTLRNLLPAAIDALGRSVPQRRIGEGAALRAFAPGQLEAHGARIAEALAAHHRRVPDSPGLTAEQLARALPLKPGADVLALLLKASTADGTLRRHGPFLRLASHAASLQGPDQALWERLRPWLVEGGWSRPPKLSELLLRDRNLPRDKVTRLLQKASRLGMVYPVGADYFIPTAHVLELARHAQALAQGDENRRLNAKAYRETTGISRHLTIPLLEFFDDVGFTRRDAVGRKIRRDASAMFGGDA